jgi:hypothetical protein
MLERREVVDEEVERGGEGEMQGEGWGVGSGMSIGAFLCC